MQLKPSLFVGLRLKPFQLVGSFFIIFWVGIRIAPVNFLYWWEQFFPSRKLVFSHHPLTESVTGARVTWVICQRKLSIIFIGTQKDLLLKYIPCRICRRHFLFVNSWSRNCLSGRDNLSPLTSHTARQTKIVGTKLHLIKVTKTRGIANNWCNFKSLRLFSVFSIFIE